VTASALYVGSVGHVRREPRLHEFRVRLYMLYLDLDELPTLDAGFVFGVERSRPLSFRRRDYRGDATRPLKETILADVERELGWRPSGPVRLLTNVRAFGYVFNPVSFYFCFDADGTTLRAVLAEITNTPWSERHAYVLAARNGRVEASFEKAFHVSPFFPMEQRYHWRIGAPGESLEIEMLNEESGREVFRAALRMEREPFTAAALRTLAISYPLMSARAHAAIYWQALRLWMKRTPFFAHPRTRTHAAARS
jgi:DUF1365 family protein